MGHPKIDLFGIGIILHWRPLRNNICRRRKSLNAGNSISYCKGNLHFKGNIHFSCIRGGLHNSYQQGRQWTSVCITNLPKQPLFTTLFLKPQMPFPLFNLQSYISPSSNHPFKLVTQWTLPCVHERCICWYIPIGFSLVNLPFAILIYRAPLVEPTAEEIFFPPFRP